MMNIRFMLLLSLLLPAVAGVRASTNDTAYAQTSAVPQKDSLYIKKAATAAAVRSDTAVVFTYNGIPVFYHCKPLHGYTRIGSMTRTTFASYLSQVFDRYTRAARKKAKGHLGIVMDDLSSGTDSFDVVCFSAADGCPDTAVYSTPVFLSSKPTRPYKVVRIVRDQFGAGSLNSNLEAYLQRAKGLELRFDAIMLKDINYGFARDNIYLIRWRKNAGISDKASTDALHNTATR